METNGESHVVETVCVFAQKRSVTPSIMTWDVMMRVQYGPHQHSRCPRSDLDKARVARGFFPKSVSCQVSYQETSQQPCQSNPKGDGDIKNKPWADFPICSSRPSRTLTRPELRWRTLIAKSLWKELQLKEVILQGTRVTTVVLYCDASIPKCISILRWISNCSNEVKSFLLNEMQRRISRQSLTTPATRLRCVGMDFHETMGKSPK